MVLKRLLVGCTFCVVMAFGVVAIQNTQTAEAKLGTETKIGIMNVQQVLTGSDAGKKVKEQIEAKMAGLRSEFQAEEEGLIAFQKEIEKKSSVWSEEVKATKIREFQKMKRELKEKTDDASFEMRQFQNKELDPIVKKLDGVVKEFGEKGGYTVILDAKAGVVFLDRSVEISDQLIAELNKVMK